MVETKIVREIPENQNAWLESRPPLREECLCAKGLKYYREWVEAGMPRKDR